MKESTGDEKITINDILLSRLACKLKSIKKNKSLKLKK